MSGDSDLILQTLRDAAVALGEAYCEAVDSGDDAAALASAQQLLVRFSEAIPHEDQFNSTHVLLLNMLFAYQEIGAGRMKSHSLLRGRHAVGGIGQLSAARETANGLGAAVIAFLMKHGKTEDAAAALVSKGFTDKRLERAGITAVKDWSFAALPSSRRRLLRAVAEASRARIDREYADSPRREPQAFAKKWLADQLDAMFLLSPR